MIYLGIAFAVYVLVSLWYMRKLHRHLKQYQQTWEIIESMSDHNKDGDVILHVRHTEK